jgi:ketol-acid reductoisomerase
MSRQNYFNTLTMAQKLEQLGQCRFMDRSEFNGVERLRGKKIVIVGCGAQGLNQGLNMRDSGLDVSYALRQDAIDQKRVSYTNASSNGFKVGNYDELIPSADLVCNLAPDKQHADVVKKVMPLMKKGACLRTIRTETASRSPRPTRPPPAGIARACSNRASSPR